MLREPFSHCDAKLPHMAFRIPKAAEASDLPALAQLADYLDERREVLLGTWVEAVRAEPIISATKSITESQLRNHLPELLKDLATLLRAGGNLSAIEQTARQNVREHSHQHGGMRWEQNYDLGDMLRELSVLRMAVLGELARFEESAHDFSRGADLFARTLIHRFIDDLSRRSSTSYVEQQQAEIRQLSEARLRLLRSFAHEMRNAVNVISLLSQVVKEEPDPVEHQRFVALMENNIRGLREMLDHLLELSRLAGDDTTPVERKPVEIAKLAEELGAIYEVACEAKNLRFTCSVAPTLDTVQTDPGKLRQIANNLLNNAVKFTASGEITLELCDVDAERWSLIVKDTGLGISAGARERLFREFYRAPGSENIPGSGLGLAITRRLTELLGGTIHVESEPGKGSCFEVILAKI